MCFKNVAFINIINKVNVKHLTKCSKLHIKIRDKWFWGELWSTFLTQTYLPNKWDFRA